MKSGSSKKSSGRRLVAAMFEVEGVLQAEGVLCQGFEVGCQDFVEGL